MEYYLVAIKAIFFIVRLVPVSLLYLLGILVISFYELLVILWMVVFCTAYALGGLILFILRIVFFPLFMVFGFLIAALANEIEVFMDGVAVYIDNGKSVVEDVVGEIKNMIRGCYDSHNYFWSKKVISTCRGLLHWLLHGYSRK